MKDCNKNKESSHSKYWDVNNQYGWTMSQNLSINGFKWIEFDEGFIKNYKKSKEGYFFEIDIQYREELHELDNDLPFLPERMKIEKSQKTCR